MGEAQAAEIPSLLAGLGIEPAAVWSSPRIRALRTAELAGLSVSRVDEQLAEWDYGDYEGLTTVAIRHDRPGWDLFRDGCPGGESPGAIGARADRVLQDASRLIADREGDLVLVCHGHLGRVLTVRWAGWEVSAGARVAFDPAAVTVLGTSGEARMILHANMTGP
jgi:probable phosphoglycerate mutase